MYQIITFSLSIYLLVDTQTDYVTYCGQSSNKHGYTQDSYGKLAQSLWGMHPEGIHVGHIVVLFLVFFKTAFLVPSRLDQLHSYQVIASEDFLSFHRLSRHSIVSFAIQSILVSFNSSAIRVFLFSQKNHTSTLKYSMFFCRSFSF